MELAAIDFEHLVRGWQHLVGARVQKIYLRERTHLFSLYKSSQQALLITDGSAFLTSAKLTWPKSPSGYGLFLRRRLMGGRITAIRLAGWERILVIDFDTYDGPVSMVFEILGDVNSMFVKDGKIVSCLSTHNYGGRVIRGGVEYMPPPARLDPTQTPLDDLLGKPAAKTIATVWGLGGKWAEELCARAGIDRAAPIAEESAATLLLLLTELRTAQITAVYNEKDALPVPFQTRPLVNTSAASFDAAIDAVLRPTLETVELAKENSTIAVQRTKQERILEAQHKQIVRLEADANKQQRMGELLYEHYSELTELLDTVRTDWKKLTLGELRDKYGAHPLVKQINEDGTIEVELGE